MKSLIIDDEPLARRELRRLLAEFPWIDIVGEAGDVSEAAARIDTLAPEIQEKWKHTAESGSSERAIEKSAIASSG